MEENKNFNILRSEKVGEDGISKGEEETNKEGLAEEDAISGEASKNKKPKEGIKIVRIEGDDFTDESDTDSDITESEREKDQKKEESGREDK